MRKFVLPEGSFMAAISRRAARECALKVLYSYDFNTEAEPESFFSLICEEAEIPSDAFARSLFCGALAHIGDIDVKISENAKGWKLDRIARMSLAIMRLCTYELLYTEVPTPVAINEAVEIAKKYETPETAKFINGILGSFVREEISQ